MSNLMEQILSGKSVRAVVMESFRAVYLCHSERSDRRSDEKDVEIHSDKILDVGDSFELDGLTWYVDKILRDPDRDISEKKEFKGSGKRIDFDDDLVVVYDKDMNVVYKGLEDYEDLKDEDWKFDPSIGAYRFGEFIKNCL